MKKLALVLAVLLMLGLFAGCAEKPAESKPAESAPATDAPATYASFTISKSNVNVSTT